jgi:hypothetical protein
MCVECKGQPRALVRFFGRGSSFRIEILKHSPPWHSSQLGSIRCRL